MDGLGVENIADGFGVVNIADGFGVVNIADAFGVVNMLVVGIPVVSLNGSVVPDSGAFVVPILGVVDLVSKYGRYPVG